MTEPLQARGHWPAILTALVEEQPGKSTMELTRLLCPDLKGRPLERKRKAVHQALTRMVSLGGIGCSVSIEWVHTKRSMVARWYPLDVAVPMPVRGRDLVLDAVKHIGRAVPQAIHLRTRMAYSSIYRLCHALADEGQLVNVAPPPLQCWVLPDGDRTPFEVPAHYRVPPQKRPGYQPPAPKPKAAKLPAPPTKQRVASQPPYINPIRARALGLTVGAQHV